MDMMTVNLVTAVFGLVVLLLVLVVGGISEYLSDRKRAASKGRPDSLLESLKALAHQDTVLADTTTDDTAIASPRAPSRIAARCASARLVADSRRTRDQLIELAAYALAQGDRDRAALLLDRAAIEARRALTPCQLDRVDA